MTITLADAKPTNLHIALGTKGSLVFHNDGKVTVTGDYEPDEAAKLLIERLVEAGFLSIAEKHEKLGTIFGYNIYVDKDLGIIARDYIIDYITRKNVS